MKQSYIIALFTIILFAGLANADPVKFTFSAGAGAMSGSVNVAEEKGFFEQEGIRGSVDAYNNGQISFEEYLAGKNDAATTGTINVVLTDFDVTKHRLIANLAYTDNQTKLLAKKSAGITKIADLKGKRIGTVRATTAHFYLCRFLVLNGIPTNQVNIVYLTKKELPTAIAKGEVDAICQHGMPIENAKEKLGDDWVVFQDNTIIRKCCLLIVPLDTIQRAPQTIDGALKAIIQANRFIHTDTQESVEIIAKAKKYPVEVMDQSVRKEMDFNVTLEQSLLLTLETIEQWAIDNNLVSRTTPRNYLDFIDYRPLERIDGSKVTIIR